MKLTEKFYVTRISFMLLLASLSLFVVSSFASAAAPKIGDSYGGGVVFYVDTTAQHGLIAAKADVTGSSYGKTEGFFDFYSAKNAANGFVDGYSDWFLPNKEQLHQLYLHRAVVGGFTDTIYWSSSESDSENGWGQSFKSGDQLVGKKSYGSHVRPVRFF
jgi:hypothetical protein